MCTRSLTLCPSMCIVLYVCWCVAGLYGSVESLFGWLNMAYVYNETRHHIGLPVIRRVSTHHREANSYRLYANLLGPAYAAAVQLSLSYTSWSSRFHKSPSSNIMKSRAGILCSPGRGWHNDFRNRRRLFFVSIRQFSRPESSHLAGGAEYVGCAVCSPTSLAYNGPVI